MVGAVAAIPATAHRTVVLELVGPAGVGKSTIAARLRERHGVPAGPSLWNVPPLDAALAALRLAPLLVRICGASRSVPLASLKQIVRLTALERRLRRERVPGRRTIVLDEGPIFALAWLLVFAGPRVLRAPAFDAWRRRALRQWARALDVVIVLDAPDALLARRIRDRVKPHMVKGGTDAEIAAFASAFRAAFDDVLAAFSEANGPEPCRLDADSVRDLAVEVQLALEERLGDA